MTGVKNVLIFLILLVSFSARAELVIPIISGVDNPTKIAVVPFASTTTNTLPENVAEVVSSNLYRSGQFETLAPSDMLSFPSLPADVVFRDWRLLGSEYLLIGQVQQSPVGFSVSYSLYDVFSQRPVIDNRIRTTGLTGLRRLAHDISDEVYEAITGIRGVFATRIIYVEHIQQEAKPFRLILADADGANTQELLRSDEPIMSPDWSPDGKSVAYVSFETSRPAIYIQELATGARQQITNFSGLNGAPAFSPDGKKLALVLSKDGNPEIYTLDLASRQLRRITRHFGIDTEPSWSTDGKAVVFTSNRGGKPQIYQVTLASGRIERLTFDGDYNANAQVTPDGKGIVMVHRYDEVFHIAVQEITTGNMRILTQTTQDESPSIAPNGATLLYATKERGKGILGAVSLDAGVKNKWPLKLVICWRAPVASS